MDHDAGQYRPEQYGEDWADVYDDVFSMTPLAPEDLVAETVAELAAGGRVLELAIGTGRLALPIAARGVEIHGVDASPAMVERLRAKPGGADIPVTMGDFSEPLPPGPWSVVLLGFNTLFALPDQDRQVATFAHVADVLADDGVFVLEAFVPDAGRYDRGQTVRAIRAGHDDEVQIEASFHDAVAQRSISKQVVISESKGIRVLPVRIRYAWPSELDLMARLAGLELRERWGDWDRTPLTDRSARHVSIYGRR